MKNSFEFSELCSRWDINKYDLAEIVFDGKLMGSYADDRSALYIVDGGHFIESQDGQTSILNPKPLLVSEIEKLRFRRSAVENYEKKNGITPHLSTTDQMQENFVSAESQGNLAEPSTQMKRCSRSSKLRENCIEFLLLYLKQQKERNMQPDRREALDILMNTIIKEKFKKRTVWGWIKRHFDRLPAHRPKIK